MDNGMMWVDVTNQENEMDTFKIIKECVNAAGWGDHEMVNMQNAIAGLLGVVQTQQSEITALKADVERLLDAVPQAGKLKADGRRTR